MLHIRRARLAFEEEQRVQAAKMTSAARQMLAEAAMEVGADSFSTGFDDAVDDFVANTDHDQMVWLDDDDAEDSPSGTEVGHDGAAVDGALNAAVRSYGFPLKRQRNDQRTRLERNRQLQVSWSNQLPQLTSAYLKWKHSGDHSKSPSRIVGSHIFEVCKVSLRDYTVKHPIVQLPDQLANVALIEDGLLGSSPLEPAVAITLESLELYHLIRRRQSSFSIQAITKVLCALHNVTYFQTFRRQFSDAFDIYLMIRREVQKQVDAALDRGQGWRLRNACPPCSFKLPNEPKLVPARLHAMDGNNSAKRVDRSGHADPRVFDSDYFIPVSQVDHFKDDVKLRPGTKGLGDSTEGLPFGDDKTVCTEHWAAANAINEGTIQTFDQTGIFLSACRHSIVETVAEMLHSGELAKYPLATLNELLGAFREDQGVGYDIGCSHRATVKASSISQKAECNRLVLVVNAFHGHAHNHMCQLRHLPLYLFGFGIEDLETCERIFSASNHVARLIRHASLFHWRQFLDLHFDQWDKDKYLELSKFLYNNYRQALAIISEYTPQVNALKIARGFSDDDFERWQSEELEYLSNLAAEPEYDVLAVAYVEALEALAKAQATYGHVTTVEFMSFTPADFRQTGTLSRADAALARARESERAAAVRKLELQMNVVDDTERRLGVDERWTPGHAEYQRALQYLNNRKFIRAVEALEGLVVQRLFELSKANLIGTGYKMRKHISKAITRRSAALRMALDKYNRLAPQQDPPRPVLDYGDIATYGWLNDFELLKHSRHHILARPWSVPANREVATKYFKIKGAYSEISRLNVEIRRLHAWVDHEDQTMAAMASRLAPHNPLLSAEVNFLATERRRVNNVHRVRLNAIYALKGFVGTIPGMGGEKVAGTDSSSEGDCAVLHDLEGCEVILTEEDDTLCDEVIRLGDCMDRLCL